jgi:hypothetical protein
MLIGLLRFAFRMLMLAAFIYVGAFVKLGKFTFFEHVSRIAATEEVHDLKSEVVTSVKSAHGAVTDGLGNPQTAAPRPR